MANTVPRSANKKPGKKKWSSTDNSADGALHCETCGQPLTKLKGYMKTGMCGPCATGKASMISEFGETY